MTREQMEAIAERAVIWAHAARAWDVGAPGVAPKTALDDLRDEVWEALGWSETEEQDSTELAREEYAVAVGAAGYTG